MQASSNEATLRSADFDKNPRLIAKQSVYIRKPDVVLLNVDITLKDSQSQRTLKYHTYTYRHLINQS